MTAEALNDLVLDGVSDVVNRNTTYFNSPQRRRLLHLALFVAIIATHIQIVHGGLINDEATEDCLELKRLRSRMRPSQAPSSRRSILSAIADRLGIKPTNAARLIQETCELKFDVVSSQASSQ
jgi:hypothetical protein